MVVAGGWVGVSRLPRRARKRRWGRHKGDVVTGSPKRCNQSTNPSTQHETTNILVLSTKVSSILRIFFSTLTTVTTAKHSAIMADVTALQVFVGSANRTEDLGLGSNENDGASTVKDLVERALALPAGNDWDAYGGLPNVRLDPLSAGGWWLGAVKRGVGAGGSEGFILWDISGWHTGLATRTGLLVVLVSLQPPPPPQTIPLTCRMSSRWLPTCTCR